ncbi:MAG: EAL domain-containing protein [Myxococcota bacterium]
MSSGTFIGRQPIVDRDQEVVAYELLFRTSSSAQAAEIQEAGRASVRVMVNTFASLGIDAVLGNFLGFFNVTRAVLLSDAVELLPMDRVVIEVLEDIDVDDEVIRRCRELRRRGFQLALDDWIVDDPRGALLPLVDLVKVDLPAIPKGRHRKLLRDLRRHDVMLLAEKVETLTEFNTCLRLGFDRFQGFFFARPIVLEGVNLDVTETTLLQLLQLMMSNADTLEIVERFKQDVKLGLNLLRLVNTGGMAARVRFETIEDAVRHLGLDQLSRWVSILLYAQDDDRGLKGPLFNAAIHRGRLMELKIDRAGPIDGVQVVSERAFLAGMLSLADALLGCELSEHVRELHVADDIEEALTDRFGVLGALLGLVEAIERSDVAKFEPELERWDLDLDSLQELENRAYSWVHGLLASNETTGAP